MVNLLPAIERLSGRPTLLVEGLDVNTSERSERLEQWVGQYFIKSERVFGFS
jgi:hypothetical protein